MSTKSCAATLVLLWAWGCPVLAQGGPAGSPARGQAKSAMCIGCHGIEGYRATFPEVYRVPRISGQNAGYIAAALAAYRKGERRHPSMRGVAGSLTDVDIADLAAFYAAQARPTGGSARAATPAQAELLKRGNCIACHGEGLNKPIDPSYPKLAGQPADYLLAALKAYKTHGNPNVGRANAIMGGMAAPFSNAELAELASYIAGLPGELAVVPNSGLR